MESFRPITKQFSYAWTIFCQTSNACLLAHAVQEGCCQNVVSRCRTCLLAEVRGAPYLIDGTKRNVTPLLSLSRIILELASSFGVSGVTLWARQQARVATRAEGFYLEHVNQEAEEPGICRCMVGFPTNSIIVGIPTRDKYAPTSC